jgi:transcriptional regulator with XRE-family HTH domain
MGSDNPPLPLVAQLQDAIRASGLSLNELGRRTGVSEGQLSRFLRGDRTLTLPAAAKVCLYFNLTLCRGKDGLHDSTGPKRRSNGPSPAGKTSGR